MEQDIATQVVGLGGATDFSLWKLFLRADFVVKFVIILLIAASIFSWALIFDKFNIKKDDKKYFISGSARLYLSEEISELFNLTKPVGDLDVVIPDKELWINAGLEKEYNEGVFKPTKDGSMEVFNVWDPSKSGDELYATTKVRSPSEIMNDLTFHDGYWYM